jgi:hypothetical protein
MSNIVPLSERSAQTPTGVEARRALNQTFGLRLEPSATTRR